MECSYVNGRKPLKHILTHYSKSSKKGFDSSLVYETLNILSKTLRARGNKGREYEDYNMHEFD
jgi:hypothetical protein